MTRSFWAAPIHLANWAAKPGKPDRKPPGSGTGPQAAQNGNGGVVG